LIRLHNCDILRKLADGVFKNAVNDFFVHENRCSVRKLTWSEQNKNAMMCIYNQILPCCIWYLSTIFESTQQNMIFRW